MKLAKFSAVALCTMVLNQSVHADAVFSDVLSSWTLTLNNGVAYVTSPQLPANCFPLRARINMSGSEYDKALFAFVLDANSRGVAIRVVVDDSQSDCVVMGVQ